LFNFVWFKLFVLIDESLIGINRDCSVSLFLLNGIDAWFVLLWFLFNFGWFKLFLLIDGLSTGIKRDCWASLSLFDAWFELISLFFNFDPLKWIIWFLLKGLSLDNSFNFLSFWGESETHSLLLLLPLWKYLKN
jgi:hypothetical protein